MKLLNLWLGLALLGSPAAMANAAENVSYLCSHPDLTQMRVIDLTYLSEDKSVPCEVKYTKGTEVKVLWRAQTQEGYCEAKLKAFVQKQAGWGWQCDQIQHQSISSF